MFEKPDCGWTQLKLDYVPECKYCRASYLTEIPLETFNWFIYCLKNPLAHHHLEFDAEGWYWMLTYEKNGKITLSTCRCQEDSDYLAGKDSETIDVVLPYNIKELAYMWVENYKKYKKDWVKFDYIPYSDIFHYINKYHILQKKNRKLKRLLDESNYSSREI